MLLFTMTLLGSSLASAAGLAGQTLSGGYYLPDMGTVYPMAVFSPPSFVVGAGQETTVDVEGVTDLNIDFDDYSLTITLQTTLSSPTWLSESFNGLIFDSVDPLGITAATVDGSTTMAGFDDSRVSFNANQILIDWGGLGYVDGTQVKVNFTIPANVPEPGTAVLLGLGLVAIATRRRTS
jgi:hypothetical protein